jgi:hypothetical protein
MSSVRVAPFARPIKSMIVAPLVSDRGAGAAAFFAGAGFAAFFTILASFFGAAALALAPLAAVGPLGAAFFWLALFFEEAFSGATWAPCSATGAALSVVSVVFHALFPFLRSVFAHDDSSLCSSVEASGFCKAGSTLCSHPKK